jgi:hypothetical protein
MGTKMVPSYANIFMGDLEERLLLSSLKQPLSWFRFIDNVDMKWIHKDKELDEFFEHANSIHPSIKFTHEVSKTKMSFLDTTTTVKEGNMATDWKPEYPERTTDHGQATELVNFITCGCESSGAYSFYLNGLAEWDTLKTGLRMATTG